MIEVYDTRPEAEAARNAKPVEPSKELYIQRLESGHWAVFWRWATRGFKP